MVAIQAVCESNARIAELPAGHVALFFGGTGRIGRSALVQFAEHAAQPRIYIVARQASATTGLLEELRDKNPRGTYTVIEKDVSLICETDDVVKFVKARETKLDLLFQAAGYISFTGRHETAEGLEPSMTTRYYSRVRTAQSLLPLLNAAASPHVVSILGGGFEREINEEDLDLRKPGNYSVIAASCHVTTMQTLAYEHLARENPRINFVHAYPGFVATAVFSRDFSRVLRPIIRGIVRLLALFFAIPVDEAGARALFYSTSDRYSVGDGAVPLAGGMERSPKTGGGIFLSNDKSESVDKEKVLEDFRARGVDEQVWRHTMEILDACATKAQR